MIEKTILFFSVILLAANTSADAYRRKLNEGYEFYKNGDYD